MSVAGSTLWEYVLVTVHMYVCRAARDSRQHHCEAERNGLPSRSQCKITYVLLY